MTRILAVLAVVLAAAPAWGEGLRPAAERAGLAVGVAADADEVKRRGDLIVREFTSITTENALKWGALASASQRYNFSEADALVDFAERNGLRIRGHTLLWSRLNGMPRWLARLAASDGAGPELARLTEAHVAFVVGRYRGRIAQWDVVNEPLAREGTGLDPANPFIRHLGEEFLAAMFRTAAEADPDAELFLNEIFVEDDPARFDALLALAERLRAAGAPVHGIGLQGHYQNPPDARLLREQLARIGELGLVVEITELDLPLSLFHAAPDPVAAQAEAYAAIFAACLTVPACTGVTVWGLADADSWLGAEAAPLLFDTEYRPKPAYHRLREALSG